MAEHSARLVERPGGPPELQPVDLDGPIQVGDVVMVDGVRHLVTFLDLDRITLMPESEVWMHAAVERARRHIAEEQS